MARRPCRNHSPAFKAKVAVAAIKGEKTLVELAPDFDLHPNQIKQWRDQLLEGATGVFGEAPKGDASASFILELPDPHRVILAPRKPHRVPCFYFILRNP